jgi:primosomal protein N' (replication factor Y)
MELRDLCARAQIGTPQPVKRLVQAGVLASQRRSAVESTWRHETLLAGPAPVPTTAQRRVVDAVAARLGDGFSQHLLFGVTGSGKTEVYIRLIEATLARGRSALMLVPEIALTPQTGGRLLARFPGERVAILHSGMTAAQRNQQWNLAATGQVRIVLGARSAVFAPIPDGALGLIVVDEEHDGSYKQDQAPRYHGRDAAIRRAQLAGCPIVLGSATPSLESWFNAVERRTSTLHERRGCACRRWRSSTSRRSGGAFPTTACTCWGRGSRGWCSTRSTRAGRCCCCSTAAATPTTSPARTRAAAGRCAATTATRA